MRLFSLAAAPALPDSDPEVTVPRIVEWILKDPRRLDAALRDQASVAEVLSRCVSIAMIGFTVFGVALAVLLHCAGFGLPDLPRVTLGDGSALALIGAYDLGLIAACGVCLPSFYFYGLLGGVQTTMLEAAAHAARCLAVTAVVLTGMLPFYVALALGAVLAPFDEGTLTLVLAFGLALPFVAGLFGVAGLRQSFLALAAERGLTPSARVPRRRCFVARLLLAWAGVYTAVTPVMIWTLWTAFAGTR